MLKNLDEITSEFEQALLSIDKLSAENIIKEYMDSNLPFQIVETLFLPVLERIGTAWEEGNVALSQVYMSGRICEEIVNSIPANTDLKTMDQPKIALAVLEDYHLLGKRIVYSILRATGYQVIDYGKAELDTLVDNVLKDGIEILLISTLILPSALRVKDLVEKLKSLGSNTKIVVGGAPFRFDSELWKFVGADAMGAVASDVIKIINKFGTEFIKKEN